MTKYYGDIPEAHLELLKELQDLEAWFSEHGAEIPAVMAAKGMTCMAHDYYSMEMDEVGDRLLRNAEKLSPGYFQGAINIHRAKDKEYDKLVYQLQDTLGYQIMLSFGYEDE
jgi:hypothetical protein